MDAESIVNYIIYYNETTQLMSDICENDNQELKFSHRLLLSVINKLTISNCKHVNKNNFGKPYIENDQDLHFSLSHSKGNTMFIISERRIGIDIEYITTRCISLKLENFFCDSEIKYISNSIESIHAFYEIWTLKESYLKYLGVGLSKALKSIEIIPSESGYLVKDCGTTVNLNFNSFFFDCCSCRVSICSETLISNRLIGLENFAISTL